MLFEKKMPPRCDYCVRGTALDDGRMLCEKKGVVPADSRCHAFRYDPLKRVPPRPAPPRGASLSDEDFSL